MSKAGQVYFRYTLPRIVLNSVGVACFTSLVLIWAYAPFIVWDRYRVVTSVLLFCGAIACIYVRKALSSEMKEGKWKEAARSHFSLAVTGVAQAAGKNQLRTEAVAGGNGSKGSSSTSQIDIRHNAAALVGWATAEDLHQASLQVIAFFEYATRARDRFVLRPPVIVVESTETRRLRHRDDISSPANSAGGLHQLLMKARMGRAKPTPSAEPKLSILIVPLRLVEKKIVLNELRASIDGTDVDILGSREALGVTQATLDLLWAGTFGLGSWPDLHGRVRQVVLSDDIAAQADVELLVAELNDAALSSAANLDRANFARLHQMVLRLASDRLVYGVARGVEKPVFLTISQSWTIKRAIAKGKLHHPGRASESIRSIFGLAPRLYIVPMVSVQRAESYHLEIELPEGMYYYKGMAVVDGEPSESDNTISAQGLVHHAHSTSIGTALVHETYRTKVGGQTGQAMRQRGEQDTFALHIREVPPGAGLILGFGALATALLVMYTVHLHPVGNAQGGVSVPAILASLPAILAGWMVSRVTFEVLSRMSIASALSLLWFTGNALWAALLPSLIEGQSTAVSFSLGWLSSSSLFIALLCASTWLNFFSIAWHFGLRSERYSNRLAA
jgi:hypothetical protein